jgi:protocatechuate 3,4-dioxygenase beta subunit
MIYSEYKALQKLIPTGADIEGPFFKPNSPLLSTLTVEYTLTLSGTVKDTDGNLLTGIKLDFWQADAAGIYDNDGFYLRGHQLSDQDGKYSLNTIRPGHYPIGPNEYRCSHIHVKLSANGYKSLTTQLYFTDDSFDAQDHWFDAKRCFKPDNIFDFVLEKLPTA